MRVPIGWLRDYVDLPDDPQKIADRLAMLGFPVEQIETRPVISGVVAGRITTLEKHPQADRLQVASIDIGADAPVVIVTAATNVAVDQVIPVAVAGAHLPDLTIEPRKMRGIQSEGMMCSAQELALPGEWFEDGIMQLDADLPLGSDVVAAFGLSEAVLDVDVTSNRVDAMSILGIARELAAAYTTPLRAPSFVQPAPTDAPAGDLPRVTLESADCKRFIAQRIADLPAGPAPSWMRIRLALAGQRPVSAAVDVSNYVMLETAQPLHFYDAAKVAGRHLVVRDAHPGETLLGLDGIERTLDDRALVVADEREALGLAGVLGGAASQITATTKELLLESATFTGARVRRMSMALGVRTDASSRHEKLLAPALADAAAARAAHLLWALGATVYAPQITGAPLCAPKAIDFDARSVERLLGFPLEDAEIRRALQALGCTIEPLAPGHMRVAPPAWRTDLSIPADLVEEIARIVGYDRVVAVNHAIAPHTIESHDFHVEERLANALAALGYREIVTSALHGARLFDILRRAGLTPSHLSAEVRNPLSEDQRFLRYSLAPGICEYLARVDAPMRVFEIGHVFMRENGHVAEVPAVLFAFTQEPGDEPAWRDSGFLRLKGDTQALVRRMTGVTPTAARDRRTGAHPGKSAAFLIEGREVATCGRLDPRAEVAFGIRRPTYVCNLYLDSLPDLVIPRYVPRPKFPTTYRDLALVLPLDVESARVAEIAQGAIGSLCIGVHIFDEYRGPQVPPGRKSLAVRVTLQRNDATITDEQADEAVGHAIAALERELGAQLRT